MPLGGWGGVEILLVPYIIRPETRGPFHSAKNSGFKFQSQAITFQASYETTNSKTRLETIKMTDSVLLLLELFDDSEVEYDEILSTDDDLIFSA